MMLVIGSGGDDEIKPDTSKNLRQPEPPAAVVPQPQTNTNVELSTEDYVTADADKEYRDELAEEDLEIETETAMDEIDEAEEEEIEINDSMLVSAVKSVEENLKFYLGKVLGSDEDSGDDDEDATSADVTLSGDDLEVITKEISEKLENEVKTEFRARADEIAEEKVGEIDQVIAEDRDAGLDAEEVSVLKLDMPSFIIYS
jgi:hypothetical protein